MRLPRHQRNLAIFSPGASPADSSGAFGFNRLTRISRIRRYMRTAMLLAVIGVMRPGRTARIRWAAYKQRLELERELASYSTPAQRRELQAIFNQYPDDVTYELRAILDRQAMADYSSRAGLLAAERCSANR